MPFKLIPLYLYISPLNTETRKCPGEVNRLFCTNMKAKVFHYRKNIQMRNHYGNNTNLINQDL